MTQFEMFPPAIQKIVSTLEQRMAKWGSREKLANRAAKELAAELADIEKEYHMAGGTGGFFSWAERHSGMNRSTIHRYLNAHKAIVAGLDQKTVRGEGGDKVIEGEQGIMELSQKGAAMTQGISPLVLMGAQSQEDVQNLIESRKHAGLVAFRVPEESIPDVEYVADKMTELYAMQNNGEKIDKPEALNQAFKTMRAGLEGEGL